LIKVNLSRLHLSDEQRSLQKDRMIEYAKTTQRSDDLSEDVFDLDIVNYHDLTYYGTLWFFNTDPPQKLEMCFDTGSSWVWVGVEG
jgi:hypothetical protein